MSKQYEQEIQILQPFLQELPQGMGIRQIKELKASSNSSDKDTRLYQSDQTLPLSEIKLFKQLQNKVNELSDYDENNCKPMITHLIQSLQPQYSVGDQFQKVIDLERIKFEANSFTKQNSSFETENGVVYLIIVWNIHKDLCYDIMYESQLLIEQNPDWSGKAKIIAMSVNDTTEGVVGVVNERKWKSIEHYRILKGEPSDNDLVILSKKIEEPYVLLINKWGKIVDLDLTSQSNLKERINKEINAEHDTSVAMQEIHQNNHQLISKEDFSYLKGKVTSLKKALEELQFKDVVKFSLEKINIVKPDGTNQVLTRSKLKLNYIVYVSEQEKLNGFLENHWNTIPDHLREVTETQIRDPDIEYSEIKAKFKETYGAFGVSINYYETQNYYYEYNNQNGEFQFGTFESIDVENKGLTVQIYNRVDAKLASYLQSFRNRSSIDDPGRYSISLIVGSLSVTINRLKQGNQFQKMENLINVGSGDLMSIEHKQGQVLVLIYWNFQYNIEAIEKQIKMFEENLEKWGNNVRIIFISTRLAEAAKEFLDSHQNWVNQFEFYFPLQEQIGVNFSPIECENYTPAIVVDKEGKVRQQNQIYNLDQLVTSLLSEQAPQPKQEIVSHDIVIDPKIIQDIITSNNDIIKEVDPSKVLEFMLNLKLLIDENGVKTFSRPDLQYFARDTQQQQLQQMLNQLFNVIPEEQWNINGTISKTVSIPYPGHECAVCKKDITQEPQQYYSPFKSEHVCTECAEYDDKEKKGNARFKYLDILVFINGPLSDPSVLHNIDDHKLGKNKKLQDGEEGNHLHYQKCCGCYYPVKGPRYISGTAKPGRYGKNQFTYGYVQHCSGCFLNIKDKASEKAQEFSSYDGFNLDTVKNHLQIIVHLQEFYLTLVQKMISDIQHKSQNLKLDHRISILKQIINEYGKFSFVTLN